MSKSMIDIQKTITQAWESMKRAPVECVGGALIYGYAGGLLILCCCFGLFGMFPLIGGYVLLNLNIAKGKPAQFGDLLGGFSEYWKWMGLLTLMALGQMATLIPLAGTILVAIALASVQSGAVLAIQILLVLLGMITTFAASIILSLRWFFVVNAAADCAGIVEAFAISVRLSGGNYGMLFLFNILVMLATGAAQMLTGGIGTYFLTPIAMLAKSHIYLDLRGEERATATPVAAEGEA